MDSYIAQRGEGVTAYVGPDATRLLHALSVKHALKAIKHGMRLTRTATPKASLERAGKITGKVYKRGQYDQAIADVDQWIFAMRAALPVITND